MQQYFLWRKPQRYCFFLSLILYIRDFGIQIFVPLSTNTALSVSCKIRTWVQMYLSFGCIRLPRLPSAGSQWRENIWPEHKITSFYTCKLLWQFFYWCLSSWLFVDRTFRASAVELLFGIVFGINRVGEQEVLGKIKSPLDTIKEGRAWVLFPKIVYLQYRYHLNMRVYPHCVYEQVIRNRLQDVKIESFINLNITLKGGQVR